jgi:uncharacterized membrane protein
MLLSLASAACMGVTYVASKYVRRSINPETFVVFWFAMGSFYALVLLTKQGRRRELFQPDNPWKQLMGLGVASAVAIVLFFYAIQLIDPAIVSFYTRADNVFAVLMGVLFLRERFNSFEGLKRGVRPPATCIGWPVRGFLPLRGLRRVTEKVPKPTRVTGWPRLSEMRTDSRKARSARSAPALVQPLDAAIAVTRSTRLICGGGC